MGKGYFKEEYHHGEKKTMYATMKEALEALWIPFCISMMGFIVRVARSGISSWRSFISSLFCSAFAGIIAHWFLAGSGIDTQIASAVTAMAGYCGGALIDAVSGRILREASEISNIYTPFITLPNEESVLKPNSISEEKNTAFENTPQSTPEERLQPTAEGAPQSTPEHTPQPMPESVLKPNSTREMQNTPFENTPQPTSEGYPQPTPESAP